MTTTLSRTHSKRAYPTWPLRSGKTRRRKALLSSNQHHKYRLRQPCRGDNNRYNKRCNNCSSRWQYSPPVPGNLPSNLPSTCHNRHTRYNHRSSNHSGTNYPNNHNSQDKEATKGAASKMVTIGKHQTVPTSRDLTLQQTNPGNRAM